MPLDLSSVVLESRAASARQSSLRLGEAGRSECASLEPRTLSVCPGDRSSPTQDVSYSQGQPRVKGKQGLG